MEQSVNKPMIYLDNAATTLPCQSAKTAVLRCIEEDFGNPSSLHGLGVKAEALIDEGRKTVAEALGVGAAQQQSVIFTSGATESNNLILKGALSRYGHRRKGVIITAVEHPSVASAAEFLETKGFQLERISVTGQSMDLDAVMEQISSMESPCIISAMLVNNETGAILPVGELFRRVKQAFPQCITHCDAVQGFMKIPFTPSQLSADAVSVSAHKIHGVKGCGALYLKPGLLIDPTIHGGGQERGLRSGTESVPLIAAFSAAIKEFREKNRSAEGRVSLLHKQLIDGLAKIDGVKVHCWEKQSPYIQSLSVEGLPSEAMLHCFETSGIYLSSGSACGKGAVSPVLQAFGLSKSEATGALRVGLCNDNTESDIEQFLYALEKCIAQLSRKKRA